MARCYVCDEACFPFPFCPAHVGFWDEDELYQGKRPPIRWDYVGQAVTFYTECGFKYVEAPWVVMKRAIDVTKPADKLGVDSTLGPLVGSAEQSFIHMMKWNGLAQGRYCAATPCFRDDQPDALHQLYFFKVELIDVVASDCPNIEERVRALATLALRFFQGLPGGEDAYLMALPGGFDVMLKDIELGSYGHRRHESHQWVYGTGFADPRFSIASSAIRSGV